MLAIIPARGGSKGLSGKNIKILNGKPLIAYTIEAALLAKNVDRVIVSTDSQQIAEVVVGLGAEIPFLRPDRLSTDSALAVDNYIYTVARLEKESGLKISDFIVLQPTSPLRTFSDIDNANDLFKEKKADSVISYTEETHPVYWHKKINDDLSIREIFKTELKNRQAYEKTHYPNGAIFIFKTSLIYSKKYITKNSYAYIMPRNQSVDIDTIDDFNYAEYLLRKST